MDRKILLKVLRWVGASSWSVLNPSSTGTGAIGEARPVTPAATDYTWPVIYTLTIYTPLKRENERERLENSFSYSSDSNVDNE